MFNVYVDFYNQLSTDYGFIMWREEDRTYPSDAEFDDAAHDLADYLAGYAQ